jgi:ATP-dependent RNA helicase DDX55/SPB4
MNWESLRLSENGVRAMSSRFGFPVPTPVQAAAIPLFLGRRDVLVQAATGSGKTIAFLLPVFEILSQLEQKLRHRDVGAIVISPTRELANQIYTVALRIAECFNDIGVVLMIGGAGQDADQRVLEEAKFGANIIIGTPGRIEAAIADGKLDVNIKTLEVLVFDEADRLLDMGFEKSINNILRVLPKQRRTGLFSATLSSNLSSLVKAGLRNPATVEVKVKAKNGVLLSDPNTELVQSTPASLTNMYSIVEVDQKLPMLVQFLTQNQSSKIIVFVLTRGVVEYFQVIVKELLIEFGEKGKNVSDSFFALHGSMPQRRRDEVYDKFRNANEGVLICTDLVARGVDIPEVDWILQYDPPQDPSFFIHRVGRTARMGREGKSIVFLTPQEDTYIGRFVLNWNYVLLKYFPKIF